MSKTLAGLYDTLTESKQVVKELVGKVVMFM
jgi:hypothetical protein